ncbi:TfoX/Sxy family protein [Labedaea rhizosphaerae]|uniref:TfoX-like protein n=1 Tax=Labedaea rhizosphaerae TaxID=598644 RepID=A0A4R6RT23_LABRH|nr:TfoX/Sxy family protein [Labedaea rhizosphaerae]TDP90021.1 TfoX-like protein [Labedaea rhizosphaerae]
MSYDEDLANRLREALAAEQGITEQRMFGGLAFLVNGNMSVSASRSGGLLVRVDPKEADKLVGADVEPMVMGGRQMTGWLHVAPQAVTTKRQLTPWVRRSVGYARSLPAKKR